MVSARGRPLISSPHFAFFILAFIAAARGTRHNEGLNKCHIGCHGSGGGLGFEDGYRYEYRYKGSSKMQVGASQEELAPMIMTAMVSIVPLSDCNIYLHLSEVKLYGSNKEVLPSDPIHAGHSGIVAGLDSTGKLVGQLCAHPDQSSSYTNLHRAVLSLLQTHIPTHIQPSLNASLHQSDIFGVCRTEYSVKKNGDHLFVLSTRDLDSCAYGEEARLPLMTSPYHTRSGFEKTKLLMGRQSRDQRFVKRILEEVKSQEYYTIAPLSDQSAASVTVDSTLTFITKTKSNTKPESENFVTKPVLFEVVDELVEPSTLEDLRKGLSHLSEGKVTVIKEKNPRRFNEFVKKIEGASKQDLKTLLNELRQGNHFKNKLNARRIFLDGLVESATSTSVEVMSELLKTGEITGLEARRWLMSFPNTKLVSIEALVAAKEILENEGVPVDAYLGIGALVGKYCTHNNCEDLEIIDAIEDYMLKPLKESCKPSNFIIENEAIAGLKGLGNIRYLSNNAIQRLSDCAKDKSAWMRVRVAVMETLKTNANKLKVKEIAEHILKDIEEDSELRIQAYLTLVEKPSAQVAVIIKDLLATEKSHQVGAFIVSHLRNVRSSTNPDKEAARYHLGGIYTRSGKFGWDPKKYSQNYEMSYNGEEVGGAVEANVIYSQRGYLPRSFGFNLSTILYGHTLNLFEIGVRTEGTEKLFENLLKTLMLKRETVNDLLKNGTELVDGIANKLSHVLRPKRSVDEEQLKDFYNKVTQPPKIYHNEMLLDFSVKSLGAEVGFFTHLGDEIGPKRSIDQIFNGLEYTIDNAKNLNVEYSKHTTFLEGEIIYPTGLGLPMRFKTKGSAAFGLAAETKLDLPSFLQNPSESHHMKLKLIPSGSIEVIGSLTMDATTFETGVEITLAAHSATAGDVDLKLIKGKELELVLGVPLREQKLIKASTGLSTIIKHNQETIVTPIELDINKVSIEDYSGCFEQLVPTIGLTFCGEVSVPNNNSPTLNPFYGPSKVAFSVHVEDESIKSYLFKTTYEHLKENNKRKFHVLMDTPGSNVNRKVSLGYESEINPELKNVKVYLDSFWKAISLQGSLVESEKEMSVSGKLKYDENEYSTKAGLALSKSSPSITVYKPFFQYSFPQYQTRSRLVGRNNPSAPLLKLFGEVIVERKQAEGSTTYLFNHLTLETCKSNYTLDGSINSQVKGDSATLNTDLKVMYDEEYIAINSSLSRLGTTRLDGNLIVFPSENPFMAFSAVGRVESTSNQDFKFLAEFDFTHGPNPDNKDMRFSFVNEVLVSGIREKDISFVAIKYYAVYPPTQLRIASDFEWIPRMIKYKLDAKLDESRADLKLSASTDPAGLYDIFLAAKLMDKGFKLEAKRDIVDDNKSKFTNSLEIYPEKLFQVNALISHKFIWSDLDVSLQCEIKTPLQPRHIRLSTGLENNDSQFLAKYYLEADSKVLVDFFTERIKGPKSRGNFKLLLTDYIDGKGDFGFQDSVVKGSGYISFIKLNNKIEAGVDLIINHPKYGGIIDLIWTRPDKKKTMKITTESDMENSLFDTKNTIVYEGQENQINLNIKKMNDNLEEAMNISMEVKLGDNDHMLANYAHNFKTLQNKVDGEYTLDVIHKLTSQATPTKFNVKLTGKGVNFKTGEIDGRLSAAYVTPQNQDLNLLITHNKMKKDSQESNEEGRGEYYQVWIMNSLLDVSGSLMRETLNLKLDQEFELTRHWKTMDWRSTLPPLGFSLSASFGTDISLKINSKRTDRTFSGEISLKLPQDYKVSSFKFSTVNLMKDGGNIFQLKTSNYFKWNDIFFDIDNEISINMRDSVCSIKYDWESNSMTKRSLYIKFSKESWDAGEIAFNASLIYDRDGKFSDAFLKYSANYFKGEGNFHFHGNCPANGVYDLKVASKRIRNKRGFHTEWILVANNKTRKGLHKVLTLPDHPYIEYYIEDENNTKSGFLIKADKKGVADWSGNVHVEWAMEQGKKGFFYVNSDVKLKSLDDFLVKVEANSNTYNLKDCLIEARSEKPSVHTAPTRQMVFRMQHDSNTLLNGTATYDLNYVKNGIYKIEAFGNANYKGTLQPISMKAVWKPSSPSQGFNGSLAYGESMITVESVFDDSAFYYVRKYCSPTLEKKCSEAKVIWSSQATDEYKTENQIEILIDLSSVDPSLNDFILKGKMKRDNSIIDHNIELQWIKEKQLAYKFYIHEDKAGLTIGLPKRTLVGEVAFQFPQLVNNGKLFIETQIWLNKMHEPDKKTYLLITGEVARDKEMYSCHSEIKFSHPSLLKDYKIKGKANVGNSWLKLKSDGNFEFDLFKNTEDMITLSWKMGYNDDKDSYNSHNTINAKSKGLKMDLGYERRVVMNKLSITWIDSLYYINENGDKKEASIKVDIKPKKFLLSFKLPDVPMYDINYTLEKKDRKINLEGTYEFAGTKYKEVIQINNYNNVNYQFQNGKGKTVNVEMGFAFGQLAEFKASINKNPIYEWEVALNEADFLKTKYNYNKDNFKKFCEIVGEEIIIISNSYDNEIKKSVDRDSKAIMELVQRMGAAVSDPSPFLLSYQQEANIILNEILEDEAFRDILIPMREFLSTSLENCIDVLEDLIKITKEAIGLYECITEHIESIISVISDKIKETSNSISSAVAKIVDTFLDAYFNFLDQLFIEINKHQKEIQVVTLAISEFTEDIGKLAVKYAKQIKQEFDEFVRISLEEFKQMPIYQFLEDKMSELKNYRVSEGFWPDIQEILILVAESAPNPELKKFVTTLTDYIDQYVREENLDLEAAFKQIYNEFIASIRPTIDSIYEAISYEESLFNSKFWIPIPWLSVWKTGSASGGIKLSTIKWLLTGDLPSFIDYSLHFWNSLWHIFPPYAAKAYLFANEMITVDGREVSLKDGTYLLLQELNNQFSVVGEIKNLNIISLQITRGNETVALTPNGKVWMNGKQLQHNIHIKNNNLGTYFSTSGNYIHAEEVTLKCPPDLTVCKLSLRRPAFAKVRGILGTYNYESFDDFTSPSGKIVKSEDEFINSWRLEGPSEVNTPHTHKHQQKCTQLFTRSNHFMLCYSLVDPKPFREMCDHAVEKAHNPIDKKKALCQSAHHYTRACRTNNLKINLPPPCDVCEVDGREVTMDEFKSMKPKEKADIVFAVELKSDNKKIYENILLPLSIQLKDELNALGIKDIEYGLVGFGTSDHPNINYFKKDGLIQITDSLPRDLPWQDQPLKYLGQPLKENATFIDKLWHTVDKFFIADDNTERGIVRTGLARDYPWRAGSYRSIVTLVSSPCPLPEPILSPITRIKMAQRLQMMKSYGIVYNLISPVQDIWMLPENPQDILGFTRDEVYLQYDIRSCSVAKERRKVMTYEYDVCHLFPIETGGNVFVLNNLDKGANNVEGIAKLIGRSFKSQDITYQCQCTFRKGYQTKYECVVEN